MLRRPDLTHGIEEGAEIESKGIQKLFREIKTDKFPNLETEVGIQAQRSI